MLDPKTAVSFITVCSEQLESAQPFAEAAAGLGSVDIAVALIMGRVEEGLKLQAVRTTVIFVGIMWILCGFLIGERALIWR